MNKVRREDIVDYATWADDLRPAAQPDILAAKQVRRVMVEPALTFLFENTDTIRWQIQEMMRVERIVKESAIQHEIDTYNDLLGDDGELGCVLLIEIDDPDERAKRLTEWLDLPAHLYAELEDGTRVRATFDPMQVGQTRVSSVQYIKFDTGGAVPVAVGTDLPGCTGRTELSAETRAALTRDLS